MNKNSTNGAKPLKEDHSFLKKRKVDNNQANIAYLEAITTIGQMVIDARNKKDSVKLQQMSRAIQDIAFYVNSLQMERENLYLNVPINLN